jgi:hypothetical protein
MKRNTKSIIFTSLALNQTEYFTRLAKKLKSIGYSVSIVCFHEPSVKYVENNNIKAYNIYSIVDSLNQFPEPKDLGIEELSLLISHEKLCFGIKNSDILINKLKSYLGAMLYVYKETLKESEKPIVIQEYGGFISLMSSFYAARHLGIDNVFIEPSFFKGRLLFTVNTIKALRIREEKSKNIKKEVIKYLDNAKEQQVVVIPDKDKHQYRNPWLKVVDIYNVRRLFEKLIDKYLYKNREEFSHIKHYVYIHLYMIFNRLRLKKYYQNLPKEKKIIYFPLHVPNDASLTIRSPEYHDQYALLDYVCRILPPDYVLCFKEHPALVGALNNNRIKQLFQRYDNVVLLNPEIQNYTALSSASVVLTVNSKSGAEALLLGKQVLVLGDAFYTDSLLVEKVKSLKSLRNQLLNIDNNLFLEKKKIINFFNSIWNQTHPGQLYNNDPNNISVCTRSLDLMVKDVLET